MLVVCHLQEFFLRLVLLRCQLVSDAVEAHSIPEAVIATDGHATAGGLEGAKEGEGLSKWGGCAICLRLHSEELIKQVAAFLQSSWLYLWRSHSQRTLELTRRIHV